MNLFDFIKLFLIGILNVYIGALCISVSLSGIAGILHSPIVMLFGIIFIPISIMVTFIMYGIRIFIIKNDFWFILFGFIVGILLSIPWISAMYQKIDGVDNNYGIGFGIGWIISGISCSILVSKVAMSNQSLKGRM